MTASRSALACSRPRVLAPSRPRVLALSNRMGSDRLVAPTAPTAGFLTAPTVPTAPTAPRVILHRGATVRTAKTVTVRGEGEGETEGTGAATNQLGPERKSSPRDKGKGIKLRVVKRHPAPSAKGRLRNDFDNSTSIDVDYFVVLRVTFESKVILKSTYAGDIRRRIIDIVSTSS